MLLRSKTLYFYVEIKVKFQIKIAERKNFCSDLFLNYSFKSLHKNSSTFEGKLYIFKYYSCSFQIQALFIESPKIQAFFKIVRTLVNLSDQNTFV